jgi:hypothetical protein
VSCGVGAARAGETRERARARVRPRLIIFLVFILFEILLKCWCCEYIFVLRIVWLYYNTTTEKLKHFLVKIDVIFNIFTLF